MYAEMVYVFGKLFLNTTNEVNNKSVTDIHHIFIDSAHIIAILNVLRKAH